MKSSIRHANVLAAICLSLLLAGTALAAASAVDSGGSERDLNVLAEAQRDHYHGRYTQAIGRLDTVIARSPDFAQAYFVRAEFNADAGRYAQALADAGRVDAFHPDAAQTALLRATISLRQHDANAALAELARAAKLQPLSFWKQTHEGGGNALHSGYLHVVSQHTMSYESAYASIAEEMLGHDDAAMRNFAAALTFETEHPWYVLAQHCFYAAVTDQLGMAELTCTEAIAKQGHDIGDYDSLGLVHLKMKEWNKALSDYNNALATRPDFTLSLYGRGIAKHALGDTAGGDADIAAAKSGEPDVEAIMGHMGVKRGA